jgi:hypothetical protein
MMDSFITIDAILSIEGKRIIGIALSLLIMLSAHLVYQQLHYRIYNIYVKLFKYILATSKSDTVTYLLKVILQQIKYTNDGFEL